MARNLSLALLPYRRRLMMVGILIASTWITLGLMIARRLLQGEWTHGYEIWDLFLAWMPFWLATGMYIMHLRGSGTNKLLLGLCGAWLLFFPNAPYLLTEFVHLGHHHSGHWWCDLIVTITLAWNGLMLGFFSLWAVQQVAHERLGPRWSACMTAAVVALGSFGVSLGRFQRFNSWDVLRHPLRLAAGIIDEVLHPWDYPKPMATAVLLCIFLGSAYLALMGMMMLRDEIVKTASDRAIPTFRR